jgi:hypothetical protein
LDFQGLRFYVCGFPDNRVRGNIYLQNMSGSVKYYTFVSASCVGPDPGGINETFYASGALFGNALSANQVIVLTPIRLSYTGQNLNTSLSFYGAPGSISPSCNPGPVLCMYCFTAQIGHCLLNNFFCVTRTF